jgi:hypothetical protein
MIIRHELGKRVHHRHIASAQVAGEGTDDTIYFLVFAEEDGRWLVDSFFDAYDEGGMAPPAAGTPAAA